MLTDGLWMPSRRIGPGHHGRGQLAPSDPRPNCDAMTLEDAAQVADSEHRLADIRQILDGICGFRLLRWSHSVSDCIRGYSAPQPKTT